MMKNHIPQRMCIACRQMKNQNELFRVVKENETQKIIIDTQKKCFGRGAYVCIDEKCIRLAIKKKGFERHLNSPVENKVYEQLLDMERSKDE